MYKQLTIQQGIPKFVFLQCSDPFTPFIKLMLTAFFGKMYNNYFLDKYTIILFVQLSF